MFGLWQKIKDKLEALKSWGKTIGGTVLDEGLKTPVPTGAVKTGAEANRSGVALKAKGLNAILFT